MMGWREVRFGHCWQCQSSKWYIVFHVVKLGRLLDLIAFTACVWTSVHQQTEAAGRMVRT